MERVKGAAEEAKRLEEYEKRALTFAQKILQLGKAMDEDMRRLSDHASTADRFFEQMYDEVNKCIEDKRQAGLDTREDEEVIANLKELEKSANEDAKLMRAASIDLTNEVANFARVLAELTSQK